MREHGPDGILRSAAIVGMGVALSAMVGVGAARWTMAETTAFYTYPIEHGPPIYARQRPVADDPWTEPGDTMTPAYSDYAVAGSTATSVQPTYLSASGS